MNWLDISIILILVISTLISVWRGFVKEAISLFSWLTAAAVASILHPSLAYLMRDSIESPLSRQLLAVILLFLSTMLIGHFIGAIIKRMTSKAGLTEVDRILGMLFGFLRGGLIIVLAVGILRWAEYDQRRDWHESTLTPYFEELHAWADSMMRSYGIELAQ